MLRVDRCGCECNWKDDCHHTGKQHTRPPGRAWQAVRDPRIDQSGKNIDEIDPKRNDVDLGNRKASWLALDIVALYPEDH